MTIEEKAKAYDKILKAAVEAYKYDKALKSAVVAYKNEDKHLKETLEIIFPELKERVDSERIRGAIIDIIKSQKEQQCHIDSTIYDEMIAWLEKQDEMCPKYKFKIGDIISDGKVEYRVDNIVKNCIGQDCYFLVNVESEKDGTRYLRLSDSNGKTHNMGEITWLCEQVDAKFILERRII